MTPTPLFCDRTVFIQLSCTVCDLRLEINPGVHRREFSAERLQEIHSQKKGGAKLILRVFRREFSAERTGFSIEKLPPFLSNHGCLPAVDFAAWRRLVLDTDEP